MGSADWQKATAAELKPFGGERYHVVVFQCMWTPFQKFRSQAQMVLVGHDRFDQLHNRILWVPAMCDTRITKSNGTNPLERKHGRE